MSEVNNTMSFIDKISLKAYDSLYTLSIHSPYKIK